MGERLKSYLKTMRELLDSCPEGTDWEEIRRNHVQNVAWFQHERLIHLIVTVTFALLTLISAVGGIVAEYPALFLLTAVLMVLLFPYIHYYYFLENKTQILYEQYDELTCLCEKQSSVRGTKGSEENER